MAKSQSKSSKRQQSPEKKLKRERCRTRAKEVAAQRNAVQVAAHKANVAAKTSPWAEECARRAQSPDRVQKRTYWLRTNQIPEKR